MRIVYIAPYGVVLPSTAAHSVNIMSVSSALAHQGHQLSLVLPTAEKSVEELVHYYGVSKNFEFHFLPRYHNRWLSILYSFLSAIYALRYKADVVVSRSALSCLFCCWLGLRVIFDSHGPPWIGNKFNKYVYLILIKSKKLIRVTVNSGALKQIYLQSTHPPQCEIKVAHNGSFESPLDICVDNWQGRPGSLQVGYAGHLYKGRGIDIILETARLLPHVDFHIIGGTSADISFWKTQINLENVVFHGFVSPGEVYRYRNMCDVLLAPYMNSGVFSAGRIEDSSKYMNPIKLIEYMASRKAIIASDLPPIRELLNDNNSILLSSYDPQDWARAILSLVDKNKREILSQRAYEDFKLNLTWSARAKKMLDGLVNI
jgi:glycosyltransferase involved in cell wall biosynthesis